MRASASAPVLLREHGGYAHSQRVERKVPPLALVPLDQLEEHRRRRADQEEEEERRSKPHRRRHRDEQHQDGEQERQRLGKRFLGLMALFARLRCMDLEGDESSRKTKRSARRRPPQPQSPTPPQEKPSALEIFLEKARRGRADRSRAQLSPHRKPDPVVNVVTAPLREHLTFDISMLLPLPIDTRQSALHSPIQRKKRRKRLKRRKRRRRRTGATIVDGKRMWQTSHATWAPHASADYAQARVEEGEAARASSKLAAKFAALRRASGSTDKLSERRYLHANAAERRSRRRHEAGTRGVYSGDKDDEEEQKDLRSQDSRPADAEEGEEIENGANDEVGRVTSDDDDSKSASSHDDQLIEEHEEEDDEEEDTLPDLLHARRSVKNPLPSLAVVRPRHAHQPAWISPDLRAWLIQTGLFRTSSGPGPPLKSSSPTPK